MLGVCLALIDDEEDKKAFETLYNRYRNLMLYVANQILHNKEEAEDAVAEAFLRIAKNFEKVHKDICPKTAGFFVLIVRNVSTDMYRKNKKSETIELEENSADVDFSRFSALEIEQAVGKLKTTDRDILFLAGIYGYTVKEISKLFNENENAIYKKISRAKAKLKKLMEEDKNE